MLRNKITIQNGREEIVELYRICKKQKQIIENVELGLYSNGIRSAYIPNKEKPRIPDKSDTKFLSKALNKIKLNSTSKDFYHQEEEEDEQVD